MLSSKRAFAWTGRLLLFLLVSLSAGFVRARADSIQAPMPTVFVITLTEAQGGASTLLTQGGSNGGGGPVVLTAYGTVIICEDGVPGGFSNQCVNGADAASDAIVFFKAFDPISRRTKPYFKFCSDSGNHFDGLPDTGDGCAPSGYNIAKAFLDEQNGRGVTPGSSTHRYTPSPGQPGAGVVPTVINGQMVLLPIEYVLISDPPTTTPEPNSLVLLGSAALLFLLGRRAMGTSK